MNRLYSFLKPSAATAARIGLAGLLLAGVTGCDKDDRDGSDGPAAASTTVAGPQRPESLALARQELKSGSPQSAQQRAEGYLKAEPKGTFMADAEYVIGQALCAQGDFPNGKKHLEIAIDAAPDRDLKAFATLGRANCNLEMKEYHLASRQYHWIETMYRDVKGLPQDEILYKLGLATKRAGATETADYWFNRVVELYATGPYAEDAKRENSRYTPTNANVKPLVYSLEMHTYSDEKKANDEADALRAKSYRDVEVVATTRNSFPVYEVHVGKFYNKNDALRAKTDADLAGIPATVRPAIIEPMK
jgi:tetratricopeptide (TPR) repeat protein